MTKKPFMSRGRAHREPKKVIYIYSEGDRTEPEYFSFFNLSRVKIKTRPVKKDPTTLLKKAIDYINQEDFDLNRDEKWCVFDKDDVPKDKYNEVIREAEKFGFKVGWSNQAFEYWLLLHLQDHDGGCMHRNIYKDRINAHIKNEKAQYQSDKTKGITREFFDELMGDNYARVKKAIERGKRIHEKHKDVLPAEAESTTTVYKLVEIIMKEKESEMKNNI